MDTGKVYSKLTSINIEEQKQIWDNRGKGYYGEYLLFTELYQKISGNCKFLMNLNIPAGNEKTTEIDLLMIHETGLYVFEAKHYKGTIYGKYSDNVWTQFFRTQANSHFNSPIRQNEYHIKKLKALFPGIPVYSIIVFTNEETVVKVTGWENTDIIVCTLKEIDYHISQINSRKDEHLSDIGINEIFTKLSQYAPIMQESFSVEGNEISFGEFVNQMKTDFSERLGVIQAEEKSKYKKKTILVAAISLIICAVILLWASVRVISSQKKASDAESLRQAKEKALAEFSKKFEKAEPLNGGNVQLEDNFFEVTEAVLEPSADLKDTLLFSSKIKCNGIKYGIYIRRASTIIVSFDDGSIAEYVLGDLGTTFTERFVGANNSAWYSDQLELPQIQIHTVKKVSWIKLSNIYVTNYNNQTRNLIPDVEIELYSDMNSYSR